LIQKYPLNEPSIIEPNIGVIDGKVLIKWNETFDHWNRTVQYKLYYSTTPNDNWTIIEDNWFLLKDCEYEWNTYSLNINQSISLMVNAKCSESGFEVNSTILNGYLLNHSDHILTEPIIINPSSDYLSKEVTIEWSRAIDSWEGYIKYSIYYSDDEGSNWYLIKANTTQNSCIWNTTLLNDNDTYKIRIDTSSSSNITNSIISSITYELINHKPSTPTITNIQEDDMLFGEFNIEWLKSEVPIGYDVKYIVEFTDISKVTWNSLSNAQSIEEYSWDLTTLPNGTYYIKIIANSTEGIQSEFELRFSITNPKHILSIPVINNIKENEVLFGTKQINWNQSIDTWNRQIYYSLLFSNDTGKSWWIYKENISVNYINSILTEFSDSNYKIKVISSNSTELSIKIRNKHNIVFNSTINISKTFTKTSTYSYLLTWNQSFDSREYNVSYYVYYAKYPILDDQTNNWTFIGQTDECFLNWNTTDLKNNDEYIINITTISDGGLELSIYKTVTILNIAHTVSVPEILEPIDITHINESITITWKESIDSWGYKVTYNIQFSFDNGTTWDELVWGLDETSYTYDTTAIFEGKYNQENATGIDEKTAVYLIKVVAVSGQTGMSSEDIIDITDIMREAIIPELKKATPGFEFLTIISLAISLVIGKKKTKNNNTIFKII